jgi:hypothetical protein
MAPVKVKVRPNNNYGGAAAGTVLEVDASELERVGHCLELYVDPADDLRGPRPTRELVLERMTAGGHELDEQDHAELDRVVAHMQLDYDHGWGDFSPKRLEFRRQAELDDAQRQAELEAEQAKRQADAGDAPATSGGTPAPEPPATPTPPPAPASDPATPAAEGDQAKAPKAKASAKAK